LFRHASGLEFNLPAAGKLNCHVLFHVASLSLVFIQLSFDRVIRPSGREKAQLPVRLLGRQRAVLV
jgi:hypothetical protein